jgi:uncharacterized repeat protein (TIGR03803 family)
MSGPASNLTWDEWGNLYGTTGSGGNANFGVIFALSLSGKEKVLYSFSGGADGGTPGDMIRDPFGSFFGTASTGGSPGCAPFGACGVVFELDRNGGYSVLHQFQGTDGNTPYGRLLWEAGTLYGTTFFGGSPSPFNGTVYKLKTEGTEEVLYNFTLGSDGGNPYAGLITDGEGNLYGTASYGANPACLGGCGIVFELKAQQRLQ